jgi:hypothetical protein
MHHDLSRMMVLEKKLPWRFILLADYIIFSDWGCVGTRFWILDPIRGTSVTNRIKNESIESIIMNGHQFGGLQKLNYPKDARW